MAKQTFRHLLHDLGHFARLGSHGLTFLVSLVAFLGSKAPDSHRPQVDHSVWHSLFDACRRSSPVQIGLSESSLNEHLGPRDDPMIGEDDEQECPGDSPTDGVELAGSAAANANDQLERHRDSLDEQERRHL